MEEIDGVSASEEIGYLQMLFIKRVPRRLQDLLRSPSVGGLAQLLMVFYLTACVGVGYIAAVLGELMPFE